MSFQSELFQRQLPLFAYGTLRHDQENYVLLKRRTVAEIPATLDGAELFSMGTAPVIVDGQGVVHGELMILHPRAYTDLLADLDQLEGYAPETDLGFYRRVRRCVETEGGARAWAWVYLGERAQLAKFPHRLIPHGDWCRYRRELVRGLRFGQFGLDDEREQG
jgi:gamma-glutamylcyclotransferase (GGCT)/AIG2-like uncharacterized protein YtfP